jgi:GDP-L-fucose synthase
MKSVLVTGGSGLIGNAIQELQKNYKEYYFVSVNSKSCDLTNYDETFKLINMVKPNIIIHLAACVGGLYKNMSQKVKMFEDNLLINTHVIKAAHVSNVQHIIACLSTCVFPDQTTYPISESMLHDGPPHNSNEGYAYAKRMLEIQCKLYNTEFNRNYICIIPTNVYGPYDNFNLEDAHVIPALIHTCYLAKQKGIPFEVKGSGKPLRQFIYNKDIAKLIFILLDNTFKENIILSPTEEYTIKEVAELINSHFGNEIVYLHEYSDGQYRKTADNSKLQMFNFEFTDLKDGIAETISWFIKNYATLRK